MHAVVRTFSGAPAKKLVELLETRKSEVEGIIRPVKGFVSYSLIRTGDGGVSVTVCEDKAGADESSRLAREWIGKNASDLGVSPPTVVEHASPLSSGAIVKYAWLNKELGHDASDAGRSVA